MRAASRGWTSERSTPRALGRAVNRAAGASATMQKIIEQRDATAGVSA